MTKSTRDLDTALDESGLFSEQLWQDAAARALNRYLDHDAETSTPEWLEDLLPFFSDTDLAIFGDKYHLWRCLMHC